eukprot:TRINITY_DN688_c0_g1_i11.p1 TRINITY_DN688_c0_g1~~TRINITY_DN688_c0_g1_i11.p1  ORF type:complete len:103 (-),score=8.42 TRINITY_DN688_c0_g1_i11:279-587(-)
MQDVFDEERTHFYTSVWTNGELIIFDSNNRRRVASRHFNGNEEFSTASSHILGASFCFNLMELRFGLLILLNKKTVLVAAQSLFVFMRLFSLGMDLLQIFQN